MAYGSAGLGAPYRHRGRWWWQPYAPPGAWQGPTPRLAERQEDEEEPTLGQTAEILRERAAAVANVSDEVRELQQALTYAGFDPGPIDGILGPRTQAALRAFQIATGQSAPTAVPPRPVAATPTTIVAPLTAAAMTPATWWIVGGVGAGLLGLLMLGAPGPRVSRVRRVSRARRRR